VAPTQARVLDRWSDGTARWLLIDARVDVGGAESSEYFLEVRAAEPSIVPAISISEVAGSVAVDTSAARFTIGPGEGFPFLSPATAIHVTDASGVDRKVTVLSVHVEERGPLRSVVRINGTVPAGAEKTLDVTARVHFFAGLPTIRLLVTVTNSNRAMHKGGFWDLGDPGSILVKDISLSMPLEESGSGVRVSPEHGAPWSNLSAPFELYQDSSGGEQWQSTNHINRERRVATTFRGYRLRSTGLEQTGLRATPVVAAGRVAISMPHFWQNFPKAIEANGSVLILRLFPGQFSDLHEIQGGEQKTYECFLSFGADEVSDEPLEWCRARAVPCVDPEWVLESGAVPFLAPLNPEHAALLNAAVDGADRFDLKREVIDEYGWRHFGEIYGDHESIRQKTPPIVSHYNNQYDPVAGFTYQFLRTADTRWWTMATELASHVTDIDVYHTTRDKSAYNRGLFWHTYHYGDADTATHRTYPASAQGKTHGGGPSADHNYTTGLMHHYFLTGDEASRQTAIELGQFVIDLDDGRQTVFRWLDRGDTGRATVSAGYYGPGRGPANSVNALLDAHRLSGDSRFLAKAEQLIQRVVHPGEDIRKHGLDEPEHRWFYTMFLQSLGKYLHIKAERGELDALYSYGRASLQHYARWMAANEYPCLDKPEKLEFPTETWAAQDIRKSDVFHYAAMHSEGEERQRFDERGRFFHQNSVASLHGMPTRALARPVIVLLTSGFLDAWRTDRPQVSEPAPAAPAAHGAEQTFVPQRVRAERRAKLLAGAALVGGMLAAIWVFVL
jgi:hypothetical protein